MSNLMGKLTSMLPGHQQQQQQAQGQTGAAPGQQQGATAGAPTQQVEIDCTNVMLAPTQIQSYATNQNFKPFVSALVNGVEGSRQKTSSLSLQDLNIDLSRGAPLNWSQKLVIGVTDVNRDMLTLELWDNNVLSRDTLLAKTQPLALSALLSQQAVSQEVTFFPVQQQQQQQGQGVQQGMAQQQTTTTTMGGAGAAGGYFARAMLNLRLLPAGTTATGQQAMLGQQAGYGTQQPYGVAGAQDPSKVSGGAYGGQAGMQQPVGYGTTTGVGQQFGTY